MGPVDYDPEAELLDADSDSDQEPSDVDDYSDEEEEETINPRAHYAKVEPSQMRKRAAISESDKLRDSRYQGVKSSRADLYASGSETEQSSDDLSSEEDDNEEQDEDEDDADLSSDTQEEYSSDIQDRKSKGKQLRFEEQQSDDDRPAANDGSGFGTIAEQMSQSAAQAKAIKSRRLQDAEKGRQVRKQLKTFDRILESRIKAQSVLREVNRLPDPALYTSLVTQEQQDSQGLQSATQLLEQLLDLSEKLFAIRARLTSLNTSDESGEAVSPPSTRKRKRDFDIVLPDDDDEQSPSTLEAWSSIQKHDQIEATLRDVLDYSTAVDPQRREVLDKWSLKVTSAASAATANGANKFQSLKAVNQTPSIQIDNALSGDGMARLVTRTRTIRGEGEAERKLGSAPAAGETQDVEVFDDSDFYSHLLKELIDRRSGTSELIPAAAVHGLINGKKKRANVDTKASKGRKLRYDVNEKIVSFMPPMKDRLKWGEAQIERLFRQLAAASHPDTQPSAEEEGEDKADLAGLRVFG